MALRLVYRDRYRLWADLVHTNAERVFVATEDTPRIGSEVSLELVLPDPDVTIVLSAIVLGMRPNSERFPGGVFLKVYPRELEKCRAYLGLNPTPLQGEAGRQSSRVDCELPMKLVSPPAADGCVVKNISETGVLATIPLALILGQRVAVTITLDNGKPLTAPADVTWVRKELNLVGLKFVDLSRESADALQDCIHRLSTKTRRAAAPTSRVLIAEDDSDVMGMLEKVLAKNGFAVNVATRGDEAVNLVRRFKPNLVLLDVLMPGLDGKEVCKRMRADAEMAHIPVILLSALDKASLHAVADEAGATDYLSKPLRLAELLAMVSKYVRPVVE